MRESLCGSGTLRTREKKKASGRGEAITWAREFQVKTPIRQRGHAERSPKNPRKYSMRESFKYLPDKEHIPSLKSISQIKEHLISFLPPLSHSPVGIKRCDWQG